MIEGKGGSENASQASQAGDLGLDVSPEFIEENKNIGLVKPRHKFAPYTRSQRRKRRAQVARLHFEEGMPAVKIAEVMRIDRNTINADLKLAYTQEMQNYDNSDMQFGDYVEKQLVRLERQRDRLGLHLADAADINNKIAIERLIADIDFRLLGAVQKIHFGHVKFWDEVAKRINEEAAKKKLDIRFTSIFEMYQISTKARKKMDDIKEEMDK